MPICYASQACFNRVRKEIHLMMSEYTWLNNDNILFSTWERKCSVENLTFGSRS